MGTRNEIFAKKYIFFNCLFLGGSLQLSANWLHSGETREIENIKKYLWYFSRHQEREHSEIFIVFFQTSAYGNVNYDPAYNNYYDYSLVVHESNQEHENFTFIPYPILAPLTLI